MAVQGTVSDPSGAPVANARLALVTSAGATIADTISDSGGGFRFAEVPAGRYLLRASAAGFAVTESAIDTGNADEVRLVLAIMQTATDVMVTAVRGSVEDLTTSPFMSSSVSRSEYERGPAQTIGTVLQGKPGVLAQQTTAGQSSPTLRGLTGYQTLILLDGIRYNTAMFRSGPNQYMAFLDPSQIDRVELILGPDAAAWGSDSLGGTIAVITPARRGSGQGWRPRGDLYLAGNSGDLSAVSRLNAAVSNEWLWLYASGGLRRHNDLRPGRGFDSHNVFRRWFGLNAEQLRDVVGSRLQDTAFTEHSQQLKAALTPGRLQQFTFLWQRSEYEGLRSYRDLLGGLGRLQSTLDPQAGDFAYARYERQATGLFDSVTGTFSVNRQFDGSVRQAAARTSAITTERTAITSLGYSGQAATHVGSRHLQTFGADFYDEFIDASRADFDPVRRTTTAVRAALPDDSRYRTAGIFAHNTSELIRNRLQSTAAVRFTRAAFHTRADQFGVTDTTTSFSDVTFNAALRYQASGPLSLHAAVHRGFRTPNATDLANTGLSSLGFEVPLNIAVQNGALIGLTAGENALPRSAPAQALGPETLWSYETGATIRTDSIWTRVQLFNAEFRDPVVRRTLLFPVGSIPSSLGGAEVVPIAQTSAQVAAGVIGVAPLSDPRAIKAFVNDGRSRYYGFEWFLRWNATASIHAETAWSYINGRELDPNRTARRLSPASGYTSVRYMPGSGARRFWLETQLTYSGPQTRMSAGDLDDERIGASRRRSDIAAFFSTPVVSPYVSNGIFSPTGETLRQIQDRVLPIGATVNGVLISDDNARVPMLDRTAGWLQTDLRFGWNAGERTTLHTGVVNVFDNNYRVHGSGVDSIGRSAFVGLKLSF